MPISFDQHLAPFRLCMLFMASPDLPDDLRGEWPELWARGQDGIWRRVDFGRSLQARRLACMLVLSPQGVRAKQAGRALSPDGLDGKGERQNAKLYLSEALSAASADDVLMLPDRGGRGAPPWALRRATTDIALAAAAAGREEWTVAATFTHGGTASLIGVPEPGSPHPRWKAAVPLSAVRGGRGRRLGSLPADLVDLANETASRVRSHRREWEKSLPLEHPFAAGTLVGTSPDSANATADRRVQPAAEPPGLVAEVRQPAIGPAAGLALPARRRPAVSSRQLVAAAVGVLVIAVGLVVGDHQIDRRSKPLTSAVGTRAEQETFAHSVNTFPSPTRLTRRGPIIAAGQVVRVSCRIYAPSIPSVAPDGFWYRISSPPWNDQDYAPANTFLNGDLATRFLHRATGKPAPVHNTDFAVTTCGGPGGSLETSRAAGTETFADRHTGASAGAFVGGKQAIVVSCRAYTPQIPSTVPAGYAYRIASPPWNNRAYAPARAFLNEAIAGRRPPALVDSGVPPC